MTPIRRWQQPLALWGGVTLAWLAWGSINASRLRFDPGFEWATALWYGLPDALIWVVLTPLAAVLGRRWPLRRSAFASPLAIQGVASLGFAVLHSAIDTSLYTAGALAGGAASFFEAYRSLYPKMIGHTFHTNVVIYLLVVAVVWSLTWLGRSQRRTSEVDESGADDPGDLTRLLQELHGALELPRALAVRDGKARVPVRVADIDWIGAESNYSRLHLGERSYLARASLTHLVERLDPRRFVRVHRSAIVNVDRVTKLEPCGHGDVLLTLRGGRQLTLSRRYRERFEAVLEALG